MSVAKGSEELGVGVKCQANPEIAGSPRNGLRVSLAGRQLEVEHRFGAGALAYQAEANSECWLLVGRSETWGEKVLGREGNSPDRRLRSPSPG